MLEVVIDFINYKIFLLLGLTILCISLNQSAFAISHSDLFHYYLFNETNSASNGGRMFDWSSFNYTSSNFACTDRPVPAIISSASQCWPTTPTGDNSAYQKTGIIDKAIRFVTTGLSQMDGQYANGTRIQKYTYDGEKWSMNMWFKENTTTMTNSMVYSSTPCAPGDVGTLMQITATNQIVWCLEGANETFKTTAANTIPVDTANWHMITFVVDPTRPKADNETLRIYVDTVLKYRVGYNHMYSNAANSFSIPVLGNFIGGGDAFNGMLDENSWWRGRVLSAGDVIDLYNAGAGLSLLGGGSPPANATTLIQLLGYTIQKTAYFLYPEMVTNNATFKKVENIGLYNGSGLLHSHTFSPQINVTVGGGTLIPFAFSDNNTGTQNYYVIANINTTGGTVPVRSNTLTFNFGSTTPGNINANYTNPNVLPITFQQHNQNNGSVNLNVLYPNTMNLTCSLHFVFENTTKTFHKLTSPPTIFRFNSSSDIINALCTDQITKTNATYVLSMTNFPFIQQIKAFQAGTFGTHGQFGYLDIITLSVVIISMIGFNRINESVGAFFSIAIIGASAYFGILSFPGIIAGAVAILLVIAVASTRKTGGF